MTQNEVNIIIQKDYNAFNNTKYEGDKLPADIMKRFEVAIFNSTSGQHGKSSETIVKIMAKKVRDLTNYDVGFILNTVKSIRLCDMYKDISEALIKTKEIEGLVVSYNVMVKGITEAIEAKRNNLLSLSGMGNGMIKTLN